MPVRISEIIETLAATEDARRTLYEAFVEIFTMLDGRIAAVEGVSGGLIDIQRQLEEEAQEIVDGALDPVLASIAGKADLGALLTASSVSEVAVGTGTRSFIVSPVAARAMFAPAHTLSIVASDDAGVALYGRRVSYDAETGELVVDVLAAFGSGTLTSWTISPGSIASMATAITVAPQGGVTGPTLQLALGQIAGLLEGLTDGAMIANARLDDHDALIADVPTNAELATALATMAGAMASASASEYVSALASQSFSTTQRQQARANVKALAYEAQTLTAAEQGRARANIGAGLIAGARNHIINGNFDVWQRATSAVVPSGGGYCAADRWRFSVGVAPGAGSISWQPFAPGQTDVPGNPRLFCRHNITTSPGFAIGNAYAHRIENVRVLSGRKATLTFYAKAVSAQSVTARLNQVFGSGGSPSSTVQTVVGSLSLTTAWKKFQAVVDVPSISGKTIGSNNDHYLELTIGRDSTVIGFVDVAHVSLVEGDASAEEDPFPWMSHQQVLELCQRYYFRTQGSFRAYPVADGSTTMRTAVLFPVMMRATPTITLTQTTGGGTEVIEAENPQSVQVGVNAATGQVTYSNLTADAEL